MKPPRFISCIEATQDKSLNEHVILNEKYVYVKAQGFINKIYKKRTQQIKKGR